MLANIDNNNIFNHKSNQELFSTDILAFCLFIICLLTILYTEFRDEIQC